MNCLLILGSATSLLFGDLTLSDRPTQGQAVNITAAQDLREGVEVTARYRINARPSLQSEQALGRLEPGGTLTWIPEQAGVVGLAYGDVLQKVSVYYDRPPLSGLLMMLFAGLTLVGGSGWLMWRMLRGAG